MLNPFFFFEFFFNNLKMELQQKAKTDTNGRIPPYGGELKNLIIKDKNLKNDLISKATYEFECSESCLLYTSDAADD